jgi:hypothetical protein
MIFIANSVNVDFGENYTLIQQKKSTHLKHIKNGRSGSFEHEICPGLRHFHHSE